MVNGWKVTAIIFIILFIIETILFIGLIGLGISIIEKEDNCRYNVCQDYDSYYYNEQNNMCSCYIDGEVEKQQYIS